MPSETFGAFINAASAQSLGGTELVPVVVSSVTKQCTISNIIGLLIADETTLHKSGNTFSIKSTYAGQTSIVTLGTVTTGTWNASVITPTYGGTGLATLTAHAVLLGNGTGAVGAATIGTAGRVLLDKGSGADPAFVAMSGDATINGSGVLKISSTFQTTGRATNDLSTTSSSMTNATGLSFTMGDNEAWSVEFNLIVKGSAAGVKFDFTVPTNCVDGGTVFGNSNSTTAFQQEMLQNSTFATSLAYCSSGVVGLVRIAIAFLTQGTAGTIQLRFASATNGQTSIVGGGSYLIARKSA
jgi:hypothetical protein